MDSGPTGVGWSKRNCQRDNLTHFGHFSLQTVQFQHFSIRVVHFSLSFSLQTIHSLSCSRSKPVRFKGMPSLRQQAVHNKHRRAKRGGMDRNRGDDSGKNIMLAWDFTFNTDQHLHMTDLQIVCFDRKMTGQKDAEPLLMKLSWEQHSHGGRKAWVRQNWQLYWCVCLGSWELPLTRVLWGFGQVGF